MNKQSFVDWGSLGPWAVLLCLSLAAGIIRYQLPKDISPKIFSSLQTVSVLAPEEADMVVKKMQDQKILKFQCVQSVNIEKLKTIYRERSFVVYEEGAVPAFVCNFSDLKDSKSQKDESFKETIWLFELQNEKLLIKSSSSAEPSISAQAVLNWIEKIKPVNVKNELQTELRPVRTRPGETLLEHDTNLIVTHRK